MNEDIEFSMFTPFEVTDYKEESFEGVLFGLDEQEKELLSAINALKHKEEYKKLGLIPAGSVLLVGKPGTGKTTLVHKVASYVDGIVVKLLYEEVVAQDLKQTEDYLDQAFSMLDQLVLEAGDRTILLLFDNLDTLEHGEIPIVPKFLAQVQVSIGTRIRLLESTYPNVLSIGTISDYSLIPIQLREIFRNKILVPVTTREVAHLYLQAFLERVHQYQFIHTDIDPEELLDRIEGVPIGYVRKLLSIAVDYTWNMDPPVLTTETIIHVFDTYLHARLDTQEEQQRVMNTNAIPHAPMLTGFSSQFPLDLAKQLEILRNRTKATEDEALIHGQTEDEFSQGNEEEMLG